MTSSFSRSVLFTRSVLNNYVYRLNVAPGIFVSQRTDLFHTTNPFQSMYEKRARDRAKRQIGKKKFEMKSISIKHEMSVRELAAAMEKQPLHIFSCLEQIGVTVRNRRDSFLLSDLDLIKKILKLSGMRYTQPKPVETNYDQLIEEIELKDDTISSRTVTLREKDLVKRPPCVTIMGHVDHGKTTLLDALRGSNVVDGEFGGITQHIGAFNCKLSMDDDKTERNITFLDTPGHAAYSMMRSRGAACTDIIVLVIAAEDSIMAQTIESIKHAKLSGCKIIVAINKIDKSTEKQIQKCKNDLLKYELIPEEMGGDIQVVPISALKKINLDLLQEEIWTRAEVMELKGDPKSHVEGYVIESSQDLHKGKIATVLVKRGTLKKGSFLVAGNTWCKVKYLLDEHGSSLKEAGLSQAVQVMGWKDLPSAGDEVLEFPKEDSAKNLVELRLKKATLMKIKKDKEIIDVKRKDHESLFKIKREERKSKGQKYIHDDMYDKTGQIIDINNTDGLKQFQPKTLNIILKTDVNGSLDAILNVFETYDRSDKVILDLVHFEVGQIKKNDLELAETFNAPIYCFNLPVDQLEKNNQNSNVKIKHFNVIYQMFDDIKEELAEMAPLEEEETEVGEAQIQKAFTYDETNTKSITVAGSRCTEGMIDKKKYFRLIRNNEIIEDRLSCDSLKHIKTDINTVKRNVEFGISFKRYDGTFESGDKIICYDIKMVKTPIDWNLGF